MPRPTPPRALSLCFGACPRRVATAAGHALPPKRPPDEGAAHGGKPGGDSCCNARRAALSQKRSNTLVRESLSMTMRPVEHQSVSSVMSPATSRAAFRRQSLFRLGVDERPREKAPHIT